MSRVEYYFDFSCPYAYIGSTRIKALCDHHGAELIPRPFLLGGVFRHWARPQNMAAGMSPAKARHNVLDMQRWADFYEVPFRFPSLHPKRTVEALRLLLASPEEAWWPLIEGVFRAYWVENRDVHERAVLTEIANAAGLDGAGLMARVDSPEVKAELRARTDTAIERGVFGAPTTFIDSDEDGYWGQDRLHLVENRIAAPGAKRLLPDNAQNERLALIPRTQVRFYFDFSSPFAHLASTQVESVCERAGAGLVWHPMLLGAVFKEVGAPDVPMQAMVPPKQKLSALDMSRYAELYGVDFNFPSRFPMRTVKALRLVLAAFDQLDNEHAVTLVHRVFRAFWVEDQDISDVSVLSTLCSEIGLDADALLEATGDPAIKQRLFQTTSEAVSAGVFGAPSFRIEEAEGVDGEVIWGQDRLSLLSWIVSKRTVTGA